MCRLEKEYLNPYKVFKKYFPKGTIKEFNKAFVTFDVSKTEFDSLKQYCYHSGRYYVCWDTVVFDLKYIKSPLRKCYGTLENNNIINQFRKI